MPTLTEYQDQIDLYYRAKSAYYQGEAILTDDEFDQLEDSLIDQGFDPTVGYQEVQTNERAKVQHRFKMLSLGKIKVQTDGMPDGIAEDLFRRWGHGDLSWKYDGIAISASYTDGKLIHVATRGNGHQGVDVTEKIGSLFPAKIKLTEPLDIRFEMVMNQRLFETKYADQYAHSRNLVAGIVNEQDTNDPRKLDLTPIALEVVRPDGTLINPDLVNQGQAFEFKATYHCTSPDEIKKAFDQMAQTRFQFPFGTDGVVYTTTGTNRIQHDGKYPEHAIAIKFKPPRLISEVTGIKWKLHRTGRYVPTVLFQPVEVDGRKIQRASGHNLKYLVHHGITIGSKVWITLANDIIPMIKKAEPETEAID